MRYFYFCQRTRCPNHRGIAAFTDRPPPTANGAAPLRCPRCSGPITWFADDEDADGDGVHELPTAIVIRGRARRSAPRTLGIVLERVPFNGHRLRMNDDDAAKRYGGAAHPDDPGQHVDELKLDLLLLGYYFPGRFDERAGRFHENLLGAVLAFKYDLVEEYGIAASAETEPLTHTEDLMVENVGPIQYDQSLSSASNPFAMEFRDLFDALVPRKNNPFGDKLEAARASWATWRQRAERAEERHRGDDPVIQPALDVPQKNRLTAALERTTELADSATLSPVAGEPADPDMGSPLDARGMEWLADLEQRFATWVGLCDAASAEVDAWDTEATGQAHALREDLARLRALGTGRTLQSREAQVSDWEHYRDEWRSQRRALRRLVGRVRSYIRQNIESYVAYYDRLVRAGTVDTATGMYIKHILMGHHTIPTPNGERAVFVVPTNDEIVDTFPSADFRREVDAASTEMDVPPEIAFEQLHHEGGYDHTSTVMGWRIVKYGVDWENGRSERHTFRVMRTDPGPWRHSAGWGITQYTTFSRSAGGLRHRGGIPLYEGAEGQAPEYIRSARANVRRGIQLLADSFTGTAGTLRRRDCTFAEAGGARFDCTNCLSPARFGQPDVPSLQRLFVAVDNSGHIGGHQFSYQLNLPEERMREIFRRPTKAFATAANRIEWPCSRLTAKMRYGGAGPQAWRGMLRAIGNLASGNVRTWREAQATESTETGGAAASDTDAAAAPTEPETSAEATP